jgi:hypothetical protein
MATTTATGWQITSRIAAGLLGSYAFVWGLVMLGVALCLKAGMAYGDSMALAALYAFVVFLITFLWAFAAASARRVWAVLLGGGVLMTSAGWWIARLNG